LRTRKILAKRPETPPNCEKCGEPQTYVSNMHTIVLETFDNGLMPNKVYRLRDIEQMKKDRQADWQLTQDDTQGII